LCGFRGKKRCPRFEIDARFQGGVVDRGYIDFARLHAMHRSGAFFVTRAKSNMNFHRRYSAPTDRTTGIICDQIIALDGQYARQH
jgi:Transposase DDE domain